MDRQALLKALKAVLPGIAKEGSLVAGADSFVFRDGLIRSYNNNLSILYPLDIGVDGVVKATELVRVLDRMSGNNVDISLVLGSLVVTDGRTTLSMKLIETSTTDLLDRLGLEGLDWDPLPDGFIRGLGLCLPCVSRVMTHGALIGIRVDGTDIMSSDNYRSTWVGLPSSMPAFTIPGPAVADLLKVPNLEMYSITNAWAHFMSKDGAIFSGRLIATEFPTKGLKQKFPSTLDGCTWILPDGLEEALDRVGMLAYDDQDDGIGYVELSVLTGAKGQGDWLLVKGERQCGHITDRVRLKDGAWPAGVVIYIQPGYLMDVLAHTRAFQMVDGLAHFQGQGFRHIASTIVRD